MAFLFSYLANTDTGVWCFPYDHSLVMHVVALTRFFEEPEELSDTTIKNLKKVQNLDLTVEESILCGALVTMIAGEFIIGGSLGK